MSTRIAINGFGRIGRLVFRALCKQGLLGKEVDVVAVGDIVPADNLAYLLKYDSTQGKFEGTVDSKKSARRQGRGRRAGRQRQRDQVRQRQGRPAELPWKELGVDYVIESTGLFTEAEKAKGHLAAGAKKVIISAPGQGRGHHRRHGRQPREVRRRPSTTSSPTRAAPRTASRRSSTCC